MLQQTLRDLEGESWKEQIYLGQQNCTEFPLYGFCVYAAHSSVQVRGAVTAGVALRPTHELLLCCLHADCLLHCRHSTDVLIFCTVHAWEQQVLREQHHSPGCETMVLTKLSQTLLMTCNSLENICSSSCGAGSCGASYQCLSSSLLQNRAGYQFE